MATIVKQETGEYKEAISQPARPPEPGESVDTAAIRAMMSKFIAQYESIGKLLDRFMVDFRRFKFELGQVENAKVAMQVQLKGAEIRLAEINAEAQTRFESVDADHRVLVQRLMDEKLALQHEKAELARKNVELDKMRGELAAAIVNKAVAEKR